MVGLEVPEGPFGGSMQDWGSVEGRDLYVYGRVVWVGRERNGETVRGSCARSGWDPVAVC